MTVMQDKSGIIIVARTLSIVLLLLAIGMLVARIMGGLDISIAIIMSQITIGISLMVVAQATAKANNKPD
jgi:ribose/xylose/arabinose/galactoside ABC-type transport system permease subunit